MRIVVTGASGFIGSAVVARLRRTPGAEVVAVSRRRVSPASHVVDHYDKAPEGDVLVHLAEDPDRARVNRLGDAYVKSTAAVINGLLRKKYSHVIYGSSAIVYGNHGDEPFHEHSHLRVTDTYSVAKIINEKSVMDSGGSVIRCSNVIGYGMATNNVVSDILGQIPGSGPLTVRNDRPVRDFIWQDDVAEAIKRLAMTGSSGVFNLGSGRGVSVGELAVAALDQAGEKERPVLSGIRDAPESRCVLDISRLQAALQWSPQTSLEESLSLLLNRNDLTSIGNETWEKEL